MVPSGIVRAALPRPLFIARALPAVFADRGAGSRADVSFRHRRRARGIGRLVAAVGRRTDLRVAADAEIEEDCRRNDRHVELSDLEADVALVEVLHHAGRRVEAEGAPARQHDGVHLIHRVHGIQEIGFSRARGRAAHVDAGGGAVAGEHDRAPGGPLRVREMANFDPWNGGQRGVAGHACLGGGVPGQRDAPQKDGDQC